MYGLKEFTACMSNYSSVFAPPMGGTEYLRVCLYQTTRKYRDGKPGFWGPNDITRQDINTRSSVQHIHFRFSSNKPLFLKLTLF